MNSNLKDHLSEEVFKKIPHVNHHYIQSENPEHHWHLLNVKDAIVADIGCGLHMIQKEWDTTPEFFIKNGAKKIIGVDSNCKDIDFFKTKLPKHDFYCDSIDSLSKLEFYIDELNVTSLKLDIEGHEQLLLSSNKTFDSLKNVAIETHSRTLLNQMILKLIDLQFNIETVCTFYPEAFSICNLVYASK